MNLPRNPAAVAQPRALLLVRDTEENRANGFWAPLIGKMGIVTALAPDGLIDVVIVGVDDAAAGAHELTRVLVSGDASNATFAHGVKPDRFDFGAVIPEPPARPRRWWSRLLFWKRA